MFIQSVQFVNDLNFGKPNRRRCRPEAMQTLLPSVSAELNLRDCTCWLATVLTQMQSFPSNGGIRVRLKTIALTRKMKHIFDGRIEDL